MSMLGFDDEGEDTFDNAFDSVRTSIDSASSGDSFAESRESEFRKFQYELWTRELMSVQERRIRFLRGMGFDEFVPSQSVQTHENEECEILRRTESSAAVLDSVPVRDDKKERDYYCSIRDLDNGKKFIVHDHLQDSSSVMLEEVGSDRRITLPEFEALLGHSKTIQQFVQEKPSIPIAKQIRGIEMKEKKFISWWRSLRTCKYDVSIKHSKLPKTTRAKVQLHKKRCMEFTALYMEQEIKGHKGLIRAMKFSPSGWYLASGGEDSVVRVWQVREAEASSKCFASDVSSKFVERVKDGKSMFCSSAPAIVPRKIFKIEETPLHEFHGHTSDILDLSWSNTDCLLTSSKDKTVHMWKVGCNGCLKVFQHNDYVTCIQFNPIDERYFISGSIDGKVRIWEVSEKRVVGWADIRDIVTAICYQPDGKGFVVGSITGDCHLFHCSDGKMWLDTRFSVMGRKKSSGKQITCLQFLPNDSAKVMISAADSKIRIFHGVEVIHKLQGPRKSQSQLCASFTSNGRYIVSVDEDSHVYIWNYNESRISSTKGAKVIRSCELFDSEGVSMVVPWPGINCRAGLCVNNVLTSSTPQKTLEPSTCLRDPDCFPLGVWFFPDGSPRGSATWPEEKLHPSMESSTTNQHHQQTHLQHQFHCLSSLSAAWSSVILTASHDGFIRSFHNYGLPVRL